MGEIPVCHRRETPKAFTAHPSCSYTDSRMVTPYRRSTMALVNFPTAASLMIESTISALIKEDFAEPLPPLSQ